MNFDQAMEAVRKGKKVTRTKTAVQVIEGIKFRDNTGDDQVIKVWMDRNTGELVGFRPAQIDLNAQNWRVVEDNPRMVADVEISEEAAALVRLSFNPSGREDVTQVKKLAAALLTPLMAAKPDMDGPAAREASIAITDIQSACMFAVAALTRG